MSENLIRGLPLDQAMEVLNREGLLVEGSLGGINEVTEYKLGEEPKKVAVKSVVVFETGKNPVTMLIPRS